jgi:predicted transcriptional regulator
MEDEAEYDYKLRGKAWKVYWLLLKSGRPMSVREVEKALRFSSPSVANHHLEQLRQLGLVQHSLHNDIDAGLHKGKPVHPLFRGDSYNHILV